MLLYRLFRAKLSSPPRPTVPVEYPPNPLPLELTSDMDALTRCDRWNGTSWNVSWSCFRAVAALIWGGLSEVFVTCVGMGVLLPLRKGRSRHMSLMPFTLKLLRRAFGSFGSFGCLLDEEEVR